MNELTNEQPDSRVPHGKELEDILREVGRQARIMHKKLGNPIASWQDGKVVIIPPEEIPVDDVIEVKTGQKNKKARISSRLFRLCDVAQSVRTNIRPPSRPYPLSCHAAPTY